MPPQLPDARRLALLHALGVQQVWLRRAELDADTLTRLLPTLPGAARGVPQHAASPGEPAQQPPRAARPDARTPPTSVPVCAPTPRQQGPGAGLAATAAGAAARGAGEPSAARLQRIAELDLDQLAEFSRACRACKLGAQRRHAVPGVGHPRARVMVVGEAPGAEEDQRGEPFVGAAGRLLDNMLRAIGLARDAADAEQAVYIANVIKCRPPGNRNPEPDEIAQCAPILRRQIELVQPRLLLALGRFAAQALTGSSEPIGRLRQRVLQHAGIPLVVSYHPAYLLRMPEDKAKSWADLCLAMDTLDKP